METKPLISVIIPVFRVEDYLRKCIESVINQTYSNLEIILVDDASDDSCGEICDEYAEKDDRIKVIHRENGGLSAARNSGIEISSGEYIAFVDSDDYISSIMYENMLSLIEEKNADMVVCNLFNCYADRTERLYPTDEIFECNNIEAYKIILQGKIGAFAWNRLYKKHLFKSIRFREGKTTEDAFMNAELFQIVGKTVFDTRPYYYYLHRENSITTSNFKPKSMDVIEAYEFTLETVKEKFPELINEAYFRYYWANFIVLDKMLVTDNFKKIDSYNNVIKTLKKNFIKIFRNSLFQKSRRIAAVALKINVYLYRLLVIMNNRSEKL